MNKIWTFFLSFLSASAIAGNIVNIGREAQLPLLSSGIYWTFQGDTPADGSVQNLNPPLFKWIYNPSGERTEMGADQLGRDLHVFRFQLSTNANFSPLYWDIFTSNNFENCLPPITNADGTAWVGTNYWRVIYYDRMISSIIETDSVHNFTLSPTATNWDRSMLRNSNYLYSVTSQHPHMYFSATNRDAFANYLRNMYSGAWGWSYLSNYAVQTVTNSWWNNETVFTNSVNPQDRGVDIAVVGLVYQLSTNSYLASYHPEKMIDIFTRWWMNTGQDRHDAYSENLVASKEWPLAVDWCWNLMNSTQRSNAVYAMEKTAEFFLWENWWCEGSPQDTNRIYDYTSRFINISSAAKGGDSHQRYDAGVGFTMCMSCWADSTNLQGLFPYYMNYMLGLKDEGRQNEGRAYNQANFDSSRNFADDLNSVFLFRQAQLWRNPLFFKYMSQLSYLEPLHFYQEADPFGDLGGGLGRGDGYTSDLLYGNYSAYNVALLLQSGAVLRQYNRNFAIYGGVQNNATFDALQNTALSLMFTPPIESNWTNTDWIDPDQGMAICGAYQPNDWGTFTNGVTFATEAYPGTQIEHGQIADGALQMWAYGAQAIAGGAGDYMKHPFYNSAMIFVDGIGPVRYTGSPPVQRRAQFTAFTNTASFAYVSSDITQTYPMTNYTYDYLTGFNQAANFYQYSTNSRPYLTSMKRHVLFPHRKYLVLYDEMASTKSAHFQWLWHYLEPTGTVNTNGCSFTYTCTNFYNGSNVTVYVVPFVDSSLMTLTNLGAKNSYFNPFTGERYSEPDGVNEPALSYPRFNGNLWIYNKTASTNWHFGWVVYPVKWGRPAPTITRINDYSVRVQCGDNDDTITINPTSAPTAFSLDLSGSDLGARQPAPPSDLRVSP